jgi:integrase
MKISYGKLAKGTTIKDIKKRLSTTNQKLIDTFINYKKGSVVEDRLRLLHNSLVKFGYLLEKDFDKASKDDITRAWNVIYASNDISIKTKQDEYMHIRQAFKHWFGNDEEFPSVVRAMKRPKGRTNLRLPEEMPDEDLIHKAIKLCSNPRDKFFLAYDGLDAGARPVELRTLRWKDLKKDEHSYYFNIYTAKKSGQSDYRPIRVIFAEPYLLELMKVYPGQRQDDEYVFCKPDNPDIPMSGGAVTSLFKRLKKRLGIKSKFSAYVLRHATLTRMGKNPNVPEAVLKRFAGHTQSSNIIGEYQHYGGDDIKEMQLGYAGKQTISQNKSYELKKTPINCPHCGKANPWDAEICGFCNFAISQKRQVEIEELKKQIHKLTEEKEQTNELIKEIIKKI